jgi:hypothetical protein
MMVTDVLLTMDKTIGYNIDRVELVLGIASDHNNHHFVALNSKMDSLLQKMDRTWTENTMLHKAYHTCMEEIVLLKAAVDTLMKNLKESITISTPTSMETVMATSTTMVEIMMQLSYIQNNIQDILHVVCNSPSKRK